MVAATGAGRAGAVSVIEATGAALGLGAAASLARCSFVRPAFAAATVFSVMGLTLLLGKSQTLSPPRWKAKRRRHLRQPKLASSSARWASSSGLGRLEE